MEIHVSGAKLHVHSLTIFLNSHSDVALKLIKKLFSLIVVIVLSGIGTRDNHDDVIATLHIQVLVAHWRLEQFSMFLDPSGQVEGLRNGHG